MIWRWAICFNLIAANLSAATVSGQVELTNSLDRTVQKQKNYSGVVLWLEPMDRSAAPAIVPKTVKMLQQDKHFLPHVVAIPVGGTVELPNNDLLYHSAFSNFSGEPFDIGLYPPNTSRSHTFKRAGIDRVFCNIHATMSAIIAVVSTPYYAVTPETGKFGIPNVPPGDYQLGIFYERALPANLKFLEHRISVPDAGLVLPLISISETGYVPQPHLDKHGKPYAPATGLYNGYGQ